jgi:hypothetical protein
MTRNHPPCNSCANHDCRACAWTSPLDASYRNFVRPNSPTSLITVNVHRNQSTPSEPSWFALVVRYVAKFFSH